MRLIWYNRDEFSDRDIAQAKAVVSRLQGIKKEQAIGDYFFSGNIIRNPFQYDNPVDKEPKK